MKLGIIALLGTSGLLTPAVAFAQEQPPAAEAASSPAGPGDIIVTARKRNESILKVPVVLTAIGQESLERFATHDLNMVAQRVPGLLIGTSLAANGLQASMRGIGTTANNSTIDNSISLNVDGVQLTQGLAYGLGIFDVSQIEVLKGPQTLFFGKNSPAGVISLRSIDPTDSFEAIGRTGYEFEANERIGELILSGPLADGVKARIAAKYSDQDGFFRNNVDVIPGLGSINPTMRRVTPTKDLILRGTVLIEPSSAYSARLKAGYERQNQSGTWPPYQLGFCPEGTGAIPPVNIGFVTGDDCRIDRSVPAAWPDPAAFAGLRNGGKPFNRLRQQVYSLEQTLKVTDGITATALTGYYTLTQRYLFLAAFQRVLPIVADNDFGTKQFTQELRMDTNFDGPLNVLLGGFYQRGDMRTFVRLKGNTTLGFPAELQTNRHKIDIRSFSVFGQLRWKITPTLELAPGARWTDERRTHRQINLLAANGPLGESVLLDPKVTASNVSPEVTLTYTPSNDLTLFAAYKTGFKSGSFNGTIFADPTTAASFRDERVKGAETGVKARLLDRRLFLNGSAYYYRYSDLQVGAAEIRGATIINRTLNAASANVYGLDFDLTYSPAAVPRLNLQAAVNYNRARYKAFPNAPCGNGQTIGQGCDQLRDPTTGLFSAQDLAGRPLVRAPNWMSSLGFDYRLPVGRGMALDLGAMANYSSRYSLNLIDKPGFYQAGYVKVNASMTLRDEEGAWALSLIGNNLGNRITSANCFNVNAQNGVFFGGQIQGGPLPGPAGLDEAQCVAERGREVWLRAELKL